MEDIPRYLYRGANPNLHQETGGKLVPKASGEDFKQGARYGVTHYGDGSVYGPSERNSVVAHQRDSAKNPTSGVSTTPIYENAMQYATHGGKHSSGYVYKIDTTLLKAHGVTPYPVDQHAVKPAILEDEEVILVASDFGALPDEIIVEVVPVRAEQRPKAGA